VTGRETTEEYEMQCFKVGFVWGSGGLKARVSEVDAGLRLSYQ